MSVKVKQITARLQADKPQQVQCHKQSANQSLMTCLYQNMECASPPCAFWSPDLRKLTMDNYKIGLCWQLLDHIIYICFRPKLSTGDLLSSFDMPLKEILQLSRVTTCVGVGRLPDEGEHKINCLTTMSWGISW